MKRVVITGVTGTLGRALAAQYRSRGWEVVGVSRDVLPDAPECHSTSANTQETRADARALLDLEPNLVYLNAGQIEREVGAGGMPTVDALSELQNINYVFPATVCIEAAERQWKDGLDIIVIGSIADGSPSCFGPLYHASKIAMHHFVTGVSPIAQSANPTLRLRLYRPGAIRGPLAWAPALRLNERGRKIRKKRCDNATAATDVAQRIATWAEGDDWVGTFDEPLSFRALKLVFAFAPNLYRKLQTIGWSRASRF